MTKQELVEALKDVPDDSVVKVVVPPVNTLTSNVLEITEVVSEAEPDVIYLLGA